MSNRPSADERTKRDLARYRAAVATMEAGGAFQPKVWPNGCGRCRGDVTVHVRVEHAGAGVVKETAVPVCQLCRVDRVKRWAELFEASRVEGNELRDVLSVRGSAHLLEAAGFVQYDNQDHAWELTVAGIALLQRFDEAAMGKRPADGSRS
jgi:hypothetical protein